MRNSCGPPGDVDHASLLNRLSLSDVEAILAARHERHTAEHLKHLTQLANRHGDAGWRLQAVLEAYALISHHRGSHGADLAALLHRGEQIRKVQQQLIDMVRDLLAETAAQGKIRDDIAPVELAGYCVHALAAAGSLPSKAAVHRLVKVTLDGLHPPG
ncbi:MAG: TetR/AcrR family transcriptional regulator [Egibacteraceae bacterium]